MTPPDAAGAGDLASAVTLTTRHFPLPDLPGLRADPGAPSAPGTDRPSPPPVPPAPATPRPAATVMLVRPHPTPGAGVEVFMLRRARTMAFAPDVLVFPGGGVDARDAGVDVPWAGPDPDTWATWLDCDVAAARGLVVAAAREVFEECGVLLAGTGPRDVITDLTDPVWARARAAVEARESSFAEFLAAHDLVLRTDLLRPHARWITPEPEPRRYDTAFFAALLPTGQQPDGHTSEAVHAEWVVPGEVIEAARSGSATLLPPTIVALERLDAATDPAAFVAARPAYVAVTPEVEVDPQGRRRLTARIPT